ncbi:MAG: mannose-1-phosphate guanylyltransferase/mannose-6-phosphate isomerase [Deltaproteobacteria bacterium]|nr:mannose-1-phosphate guanylyltransferase/mannose-6-phosphate isomerase [Deltaproteobacteria bacterium]
MIIPVIMAGGSGTRLWPLSRQLYPKQLMRLVDQNTMLQNTALRMMNLQGVEDPIVICNNDHRFMVAEQFREININPSSIILEPVGRNTAPAIAVAALKVLSNDDDPVIVVLPADHYIQDTSSFHDAIKIGFHFAMLGKLITFGILPHAPETGYGYIRKGEPIPVAKKEVVGNGQDAAVIREFVEKPDKKTAEKYIASGEYFWNSGIFMFRASEVLSECEKYIPEIVDACKKALQYGKSDLDFFRLDRDAFELCPAESIDYAVMEKTGKGAMVPFDAGWNDVGSWEALWQVGNKEKNDNVIKGDVLTHNVRNSYLHATGRMIAAVGLEDHIVVETADAVLISPRNQVQDVKKLVDQLRQKKRDEALTHKKEYRPWGSYEEIAGSDNFQVKRVTVKPGAVLSLQKHFHRAEHWIVVKGTAHVTRGDEQFILKEDQSTYIPLGVEHRLENKGQIPLEIIEVHSGSYFGEDDIIRIDDAYGR